MPINFESFPLREFRKGRELQWFPHEIDLTQDAKDWAALKHDEQDLLLRQILAFLIGERGVVHDLAPLQQALRKERGRMDEEMYLSEQLFEESVHVMFFQRWMNEVLPGQIGKDIPFPPMFGNVFSEILPSAMRRLSADPSPANQIRAAVTYHQIIEGCLAEIGYQIFYACLGTRGILPGLNKGVHLIQRDEARHIAFGTYLIQRILSEHPELDSVFEEEMESLREMAVGSARAVFGPHADKMPFGLDSRTFDALGAELYRSRMNTVRRGALVG